MIRRGQQRAGYESVRKIKDFVKRTYTPYVLAIWAVSAAVWNCRKATEDPCSFRERTGRDKINDCEMMTCTTPWAGFGRNVRERYSVPRAKPLYFLDYIAWGKQSIKLRRS